MFRLYTYAVPLAFAAGAFAADQAPVNNQQDSPVSEASRESSPQTPSSGRIGVRYLEASWMRETESTGFAGYPASASASLNIPLVRNFDGTVGYFYGYLSEIPLSVSHSEIISGALTYYLTYGTFKPYVTLGVSKSRVISSGGPGSYAYDHGAWRTRLGVEYSPCSLFSVDAGGGTSDFFALGDKLGFDELIYSYGVSATVWILRPIGVQATWTAQTWQGNQSSGASIGVVARITF